MDFKKHDISNHEVCPWFDGDKIYPQRLHMHIRNQHDFISVVDTKRNYAYHFLYDVDKGYYEMLSDRECSLFIKSHLPEERRTSNHWGQVLKELNTDDAIDMSMMDSDESIINFKNGILNIKTNKLQPHSPNILSSVQIPCDFRPDLTLKDAPVFSGFLDDLTSGKDELKTILLEYMGAIISNVKGYKYKKLLILHGAGNTGKSQLRSLIMDLLGEQNCHSISLQQLNSRFGPAQISGKRFVGSGEVNSISLDDINTIKELTGGDAINAEFKGKDGFSFKFGGFLWFNCNVLPSFKGDQGEHVYERFIIVPCNNIIPKEKRDSTILDKMLAEKEAIVSVAVKHFQRTVAEHTFSEGPIIRAVRRDYQGINNSVHEFVDSQCIIGEGRTRRPVFYREYEAWAKDNHITNVLGKMAIALTLEQDYGLSPKRIQGEFYYPITVKKSA